MKHRILRKTLAVFVAAVAFAVTAAAPAFASAEATDEYEEKSIRFSFDDDAGMNLEDSTLTDVFVPQVVRAAGGVADIREDGILAMSGYAGFYTDPDIAYADYSGAYTFSVDYQQTASAPSLMGIFVRMADPKAYSVTNPKNSGTQQSFDLYEWDWYRENGGSGTGVSSIAGSGIRVYQDVAKKQIGIDVKTRTEDGLFVYGNGILLDYPEGFNEEGLNNYRFVDDGKSKVEIFVCGKSFASVEYGGETGSYPDGDEGDCDTVYYKKAVIKDASGNVLLEVEKARISAEYSIAGIGNRGDANALLDNVEFTWMAKKKPATPVPTEKPATPVPTEKPAEATDASSSGTAAPDKTAAPASTQQAGQIAKKSENNLTWVFVVCGVVTVGAVAVIIATLAKKKKK